MIAVWNRKGTSWEVARTIEHQEARTLDLDLRNDSVDQLRLLLPLIFWNGRKGIMVREDDSVEANIALLMDSSRLVCDKNVVIAEGDDGRHGVLIK